jgi:hypothetical protein
MRYGTDNEHPFDTDNRAWRRIGDAISDHLDAVTWTRNRHGRPVLLTLCDTQTGDMVTLAVIDSLEVREPHILLAASTDHRLTAHGPTGSADTAASHATALAPHTATMPTPLHDPSTKAVPATCWVDLSSELAAARRPALDDDARIAVLVLLDRTGGRIAAVGPFPTRAAADAWQPDDGPGRTADRLVVPLHPVTLQEARP